MYPCPENYFAECTDSSIKLVKLATSKLCNYFVGTQRMILSLYNTRIPLVSSQKLNYFLNLFCVLKVL